MIAASLLASTSRNAGGLFNSVRRLHQELERMPGMTVPVFGLEDEFTVADKAEWSPLVVATSPVTGPRAFGYARGLTSNLIAAQLDILQVHGIWQYPSVAALSWHRRTKRPYIVSPHGMLDPWAVNNSHWKKRLAAAVYERTHLDRAKCVRALCQSELASIRAFGLKNACCVIPNGIDLPEARGQSPEVRGQRKHLLFLGRLHPKKGLPNALRAWAKVRRQGTTGKSNHEWQFIIAGWDQGGHEAELKRLATELEIPWTDIRDHPQNESEDLSAFNYQFSAFSLLFTGPAFGEQKDELLRRADAFILPSFSEGLPMSVLEAWAYGVPVLMTDECNLPEGFAADAALRIGTDVESIAKGMVLLFGSPISDLQSLAANGRALVERQFTWPMIATQMKEVYEWMLGGGDPPSCVVIS